MRCESCNQEHSQSLGERATKSRRLLSWIALPLIVGLLVGCRARQSGNDKEVNVPSSEANAPSGSATPDAVSARITPGPDSSTLSFDQDGIPFTFFYPAKMDDASVQVFPKKSYTNKSRMEGFTVSAIGPNTSNTVIMSGLKQRVIETGDFVDTKNCGGREVVHLIKGLRMNTGRSKMKNHSSLGREIRPGISIIFLVILQRRSSERLQKNFVAH